MASWRYNLADIFAPANGSGRGVSIRSVGDINIANGEVGGNYHPPASDVTVAPAIGATVSTEYPYIAGTLKIIRVSDDHVYQSGVDFEEVAPDQWTNLAITPGTPIEVTYLVDTGRLTSTIRLQLAGVNLPLSDVWNLAEGFDAELNVSTGAIDISALGSTSGGGGFPRECVGPSETITIGPCEQMPVYNEITVEGTLVIEGSLIVRE